MRTPGEQRSRWWSRSRGLPGSAYGSWVASLNAGPGRPPRILAWAATPDGVCIGTSGALSFQAPDSGTHEGTEDGDGAEGGAGEGTGWRHVGWHEIERGGWDAETRRLTWSGYDGEPDGVALVEPGRLPELFRERVAASIAVEKFVALVGERGVVITARRDLGSPGAITWHSSLTRGLTWERDGVREAVDGAVAELRTEYDLG